MQWNDEAIILAARPHGETALIIQLLTRAHGRHAGLVRGARKARGYGVYEIGNRVEASWQARLAEHLGILRCELLEGCAAGLIDDPARLACLAAAAAVAEAALPEREAVPHCFAGLGTVLSALSRDVGWAKAYVTWELELLAELGFGLDLSRCAATGTTADLVYVSPKSAQAVSREAGAPYRDKLLRLPDFLRDPEAAAEPTDIADGLALTGYFLARHIFAVHRNDHITCPYAGLRRGPSRTHLEHPRALFSARRIKLDSDNDATKRRVHSREVLYEWPAGLGGQLGDLVRGLFQFLARDLELGFNIRVRDVVTLTALIRRRRRGRWIGDAAVGKHAPGQQRKTQYPDQFFSSIHGNHSLTRCGDQAFRISDLHQRLHQQRALCFNAG